MTQPQANPQTHRDVPFFYVYDADALVDGTSYADLRVPIAGDSDFILRRIAGRQLVGASIRYYDDRGQSRSSNLFPMLPDHLVLPEALFTADGQIRFDINTVARAAWTYTTPGSVPNYYSQIGFQGVRRYYNVGPELDSDYQYRRSKFTIRYDVSPFSTPGRVAPAYTSLTSPVQYSTPVDDVDFELTHMTILVDKDDGNGYVLSNYAIKLMMYDNGGLKLSNAPVLDQFVNWNSVTYNSCFPVPTLVYPAGSQIKFDVTSLLLDTEVPSYFAFLFHGFRHYPVNC